MRGAEVDNAAASERWLAPIAPDGESHELSARAILVFTVVFWSYASLMDLVFAESMRVTLAEYTSADVFSPWSHRLAQRLALLPCLYLCYWASLRIGWRSSARRIAAQLSLALVFSVLWYWLMCAVAYVAHRGGPTPFDPSQWTPFAKGNLAVWIASSVTGITTYGFGLALLSAATTYRNYQALQMRNAQLQRHWTGARLAALRTQLSPHTLFNVLHTIQGQVTRRPEVAQSLLASLGDLLRRLLAAGERDFSLLREELHFAEAYLDLQGQRFSDRLRVEVQIGPDALQLWVPSLILHPLVENAVLHGLADHNGIVKVAIRYAIAGESLELRVTNSTVRDGAMRREGIGLRNVRERLAVQFADRAALACGAVEPGTWQATLTLPVLREWPYRSPPPSESAPRQ